MAYTKQYNRAIKHQRKPMKGYPLFMVKLSGKFYHDLKNNLGTRPLRHILDLSIMTLQAVMRTGDFPL